MSQISSQARNDNLNYLIDPTFRNVNRLFALSFENENVRTSYYKYYVPNVEIKDYNVLIDGEAFFELPVKSLEETYEKITQITDHSSYFKRLNLLDFEDFKEHYKLIAIDLSKQIELGDKELKQQFNFIGKLARAEGAFMFFTVEKKKKNQLLNFDKIMLLFFRTYKMETQKIINLLEHNDIESEKFATRKWYIINDLSGGSVNPYGDDTDNISIKFDTKVIKSNLFDYSDAYILVTGNIVNKPADQAAVEGDSPRPVVASIIAFKNCAPFRAFGININDEFIEKAEDIDIVSPMYNLLEYSDNYKDSTESLYHFRKDEPPANNANVDDNTSSLNYKAKLIKGINNNTQNVKLVAPLKYLSSFFRLLEMPLINCKVDSELTWNKNCVICSLEATAGNNVEFTITKTELYVPIVTLFTRDNAKLLKLLNDGFKRSVYWNKYKTVYKIEEAANPTYRYQLDDSYQGVNRLFVLTFNNVAGNANQVERDDYRKYFMPRDVIGSYNVVIDGRHFYDQPINDSIKQYDEIRKKYYWKR